MKFFLLIFKLNFFQLQHPRVVYWQTNKEGSPKSIAFAICELVKNTNFAEKTFTDCSLVPLKDAMPPNIVEKTFVNSHKTAKFTKFSPSKVSRYTVHHATVENVSYIPYTRECMVRWLFVFIVQSLVYHCVSSLVNDDQLYIETLFMSILLVFIYLSYHTRYSLFTHIQYSYMVVPSWITNATD